MTSATRRPTVVSTVADHLLSRLNGVERHGEGWRARCPSHGSERNRPLSIALADDGRLLIHCFAGCTALEVVQAVGLQLADLFPQRITHNATPEQRRELRQAARQSQWAAALDALASEARVVGIAADQVGAGKPLETTDRERLALALGCIDEARGVLRGR